MTSYNWEDSRLNSPDVIQMLASEASRFEMAEGSFTAWCESLEWSADSRGAERKFRQTFETVKLLRNVLGDAAYFQLLEIQAEVRTEAELGDNQEDWDANRNGVGQH
ncbi:MAG: hypothetical protein ACR2G6_15280 [Gemmatimonadaceae bacterium]